MVCSESLWLYFHYRAIRGPPRFRLKNFNNKSWKQSPTSPRPPPTTRREIFQLGGFRLIHLGKMTTLSCIDLYWSILNRIDVHCPYGHIWIHVGPMDGVHGPRGGVGLQHRCSFRSCLRSGIPLLYSFLLGACTLQTLQISRPGGIHIYIYIYIYMYEGAYGFVGFVCPTPPAWGTTAH